MAQDSKKQDTERQTTDKEPTKTLTVFTPTYNRAHTLPRTYKSLCRQTSTDFEWLIVDDGSSDGTAELVRSWQAEALIPIRYVYQANQGMHGAHNTAYENIRTPLNVCIDSDDWMPDDAVETILTFWREHGSDKYAGFIGLDVREDGSLIGTAFPEGMKESTVCDLGEQGIHGDKKLVYRTDVITSYPPYPIFEGERYVGLNYKYLLIDQDYTMLTLNKPLCIVEYQTDGSSNSMFRQWWNNPRGFIFLRIVQMRLAKRFRARLKHAIHYVAESIMVGNPRFLLESPRKLTTLLAIPAGVLLYFWIRYNVKRERKLKVK